MSEAQAATDEKVLGTEEVAATGNDAVQASEQNQEVDAKPQDTEVEQGKKPSGFQRRMAKFEAAIETLNAERDYWKQQALGATKQPAPQEAAKTRLDFASDDDWIEHRLTQERQRLVQEAQQAASQTMQQQQLVQTYQQRVEAVKKDLPDWDNVFREAQDEGLTLPTDAVEFCLDSDVGPKIAYHLAKNPDEYDRIISMSPAKRLAHLGKLEDRLSTKVEPVKRVSQAPAKLVDTKGSGAVKTTPTGMERFQSKAAWLEWYNAQRKR
jgi:hypothetical protein